MRLLLLASLLLTLTLPDCGLRERVAPLPDATAVYPSPVPLASPVPASGPPRGT